MQGENAVKFKVSIILFVDVVDVDVVVVVVVAVVVAPFFASIERIEKKDIHYK